jgi:hypothetical protein
MNITVSSYLRKIQSSLFPGFAEELGPTTEKHQKVIVILDVLKIEDFVNVAPYPLERGRPPVDAAAMARAYISKAVLNIPTTRALIDRLKVDTVLRRICGFERRSEIPCEASFSNWFLNFANTRLAEKAHEALVRTAHVGVPVHNVSRDSTAIEAREKPLKKEIQKKKTLRKRGRPKKGEAKDLPTFTRLERQLTMSFGEQISDLPIACDHGFKTNAKGISTGWIGYKLHIDTAEGGIPISCIITSASVHDSAAALPLENMTSRRITSLYTLMDAAYDSSIIREQTERMGKIAVIDSNPRRGEKIDFDPPKKARYKGRTEAERVNSNLKDDYGARYVRVRGTSKVMCHLMFGVLALTAFRLLTLTI